jgi:hypothetical protein
MAFENWRGTVGIIKPTLRPGSIEELIRLLPEGVGVVVTNINITTGTQQEFKQVIPHYEARVAELAAAEVDPIHPAGLRPSFCSAFEASKTWEARKLASERIPLHRGLDAWHLRQRIRSRFLEGDLGGRRRRARLDAQATAKCGARARETKVDLSRAEPPSAHRFNRHMGPHRRYQMHRLRRLSFCLPYFRRSTRRMDSGAAKMMSPPFAAWRIRSCRKGAAR